MPQRRFDDDGKHGAFVEQTKKMLEEENDTKPNVPEGGGGGGVKIVRKLG